MAPESMRRWSAVAKTSPHIAWKLAGGKPIKNKTGELPAKTPLSEEISAALKKRGFKFVGPVIVYAWMQASGMVNDHEPRCFRRKL